MTRKPGLLQSTGSKESDTAETATKCGGEEKLRYVNHNSVACWKVLTSE